MKKERPGYEWGPRWGADGSSSPAFAWGQALGLGGGDCQRNFNSSKACAFKKAREILDAEINFFLFMRPIAGRKSRIGPLIRRNRRFCNLRPLRWMLSRNAQRRAPAWRVLLEADCADAARAMRRDALARFCVGRNWRARSRLKIEDAVIHSEFIRSARIARRSRRGKSTRGGSLVERRWCVCYFLKARGVAQLGSAPALGAGGRPFKSARPDMRQ